MPNLRLTSCVYLRCKSDAYIDPLEQTDESAMPRFYWCGRTLKPSGPDSEDADVAECQPGRGCFCNVINGSAASPAE